jgi:hypothetical protein
VVSFTPENESSHIGFVVDKVALGQVFSPESFGFPCQSSFHQFLHNHHHSHPGLVQQASSGCSTQGPTAQIKKNITYISQ